MKQYNEEFNYVISIDELKDNYRRRNKIITVLLITIGIQWLILIGLSAIISLN